MKRWRLRGVHREWLVGYAFILPALGFTLIFDYYPILNGMKQSLYDWNGVNVDRFVGLQNFRQILTDPVFGHAMANVLFFLAANIVLMVPTLTACIILFRLRSQRAQYIYRIFFMIPLVVPWVVMLLVWEFMYDPQFGLFNHLLTDLHLSAYRQLWLASPSEVKWCLVGMGFPWISTTAALIYLGGLMSIDPAIWEAAALDGAGSWARALRIEWPLLRGQFKLNLVGVLSGTLTGYGVQLLVTDGGPGYSSTVPGLYMYQAAFGGTQGNYGYASAVGLLLFVVAILMTVAMMRYVRSEA